MKKYEETIDELKRKVGNCDRCIRIYLKTISDENEPFRTRVNYARHLVNECERRDFLTDMISDFERLQNESESD